MDGWGQWRAILDIIRLGCGEYIRQRLLELEHTGCRDLMVKAGRTLGQRFFCTSVLKSIFRSKWCTLWMGLWTEGAVASTAERIGKGFNSVLTNLFMIHKKLYTSLYVYLPFCVSLEIYPFPCFCSKKRWSSLGPQVCPTLYGSCRFTTVAVIIARFKKSSSNGVKWELDSAMARPRINETLC